MHWDCGCADVINAGHVTKSPTYTRTHTHTHTCAVTHIKQTQYKYAHSSAHMNTNLFTALFLWIIISGLLKGLSFAGFCWCVVVKHILSFSYHHCCESWWIWRPQTLSSGPCDARNCILDKDKEEWVQRVRTRTHKDMPHSSSLIWTQPTSSTIFTCIIIIIIIMIIKSTAVISCRSFIIYILNIIFN